MQEQSSEGVGAQCNRKCDADGVANVAVFANIRSRSGEHHTDTFSATVDLQSLETSADVVEVIDVRLLKQLVVEFACLLRDYLEARTEFVDQLEKFVESHGEAKKLRALAPTPDSYLELVLDAE